MAQTLPPSPDSSAPLPRYERKRAGAAKVPRPRFQSTDAALAALFVAACFALSLSVHIGAMPALLLSALTAGMTFLVGWRNGGRLCGIIAGSLTAFSLSFAQASLPWGTALFSLLALAALFAFACDALVVACALAGLAAAVRFDGGLLGLILLVMVGVRLRRLLLPGIGAFLAAALAGEAVRMFLLHAPAATPLFYVGRGTAPWLLQPAQMLTVWLLIPLCSELTDPMRRARWLPTVLWGLVCLALALFVHFGEANGTMLPLMPVVFVLAAGGLARLTPSLAGEVPAARHALASLAVVGLLLLRGYAEWPQRTAAVRTSVLVAPLATAITPLPPPRAVPLAVMPRAVPLPATAQRAFQASKAAKPGSVAAPALPGAMHSTVVGRTLVGQPAPKPAVSLYTLRNGHMVRRTKWAIQWDLAHPKPAP